MSLAVGCLYQDLCIFSVCLTYRAVSRARCACLACRVWLVVLWASRLLGCGLFWGLFYFVLELWKCYLMSLPVFISPTDWAVVWNSRSKGGLGRRRIGGSVGAASRWGRRVVGGASLTTSGLSAGALQRYLLRPTWFEQILWGILAHYIPPLLFSVEPVWFHRWIRNRRVKGLGQIFLCVFGSVKFVALWCCGLKFRENRWRAWIQFMSGREDDCWELCSCSIQNLSNGCLYRTSAGGF
jgi:hypothetical protein